MKQRLVVDLLVVDLVVQQIQQVQQVQQVQQAQTAKRKKEKKKKRKKEQTNVRGHIHTVFAPTHHVPNTNDINSTNKCGVLEATWHKNRCCKGNDKVRIKSPPPTVQTKVNVGNEEVKKSISKVPIRGEEGKSNNRMPCSMFWRAWQATSAAPINPWSIRRLVVFAKG